MDFNANKLPDDRLLPEAWTVSKQFRTEKEVDGVMVPDQEGTRTLVKKPVHVVQATTADGQAEPAYLVLCSDATHEVIPLSAFKKVPAPETSTGNSGEVTLEAPAAPVEGAQ